MTRQAVPRFEERLLERFSNAAGVSGGEEEIRAEVAGAVRDRVDSLAIDAMGSLVAQVAPPAGRATRRRARPHVMLCAHLDEVGLMVTSIEKRGELRFRRVGGIDPRILPGQALRIGRAGVPGVIGFMPPHLSERSAREKVTPVEDLAIDIGASSIEEARRHVSVGDYAVFATQYERWGRTRKGKAFDDRGGCAILASLVQSRPPVPLTAVWSVQEEVGLRGAGAAARRVQPDVALVLEGTASGETPGAKPDESRPLMGGGPVLTVQDRSLMANARLLDILVRTARSLRIPIQWKRPGVGGTDAGRIALSGAGIPSAVVSIPCRYIHAPAAYLDVRDPQRIVALVWRVLSALRKEWP